MTNSRQKVCPVALTPVRIARSELAAHLRGRGALVGFLEWDLAKGKGIDDHLAVAGPDRVLDEISHVDFASSAWKTDLLRGKPPMNNTEGRILPVLANVTAMGWGWVTALGTPDAVRSMIAPTTFLGTWAGHLFHWLGVGPSPHGILSMARGLGLVAAGVTGAMLFVRSRRTGTVQAHALTLLAIVLLGAVVQPWYVACGLIVVAPVAARRGRLPHGRRARRFDQSERARSASRTRRPA